LVLAFLAVVVWVNFTLISSFYQALQMTQKFARHKITVAGLTGTPSSLTFWFLAPENTYEGLPEADTGVDKVAITGAADVTNEIAPFCTVEALLKSGFAVRKVVAYATGSGASLRRRYAKIIVAKNKAPPSVLLETSEVALFAVWLIP
jgi:hypothetical protein